MLSEPVRSHQGLCENPDDLRTSSQTPAAGRLLRLWLALAVLTLVATIGAGEVLLRLVYRDGGRTTLGGPGDVPFEYTYNQRAPGREERQPFIDGDAQPDVTRIVVQGDSITWGVGVKSWTDLYPSRVLARLKLDGRKVEMAVSAVPGYNIDRHAAHVAQLVEQYRPDLLVYQWYVNDLDVGMRKAVPPRWWQNWSRHQALRQWSYLYFFLDIRVDRLLSQPYRDHLLNDFEEGSEDWANFRDQFHRWAVVASAHVPHTILLLYPQVPFRGSNPLAALHARMTALATDSSNLVYPAQTIRGDVGRTEEDPTARGRHVRRVTGEGGTLARAGQIPLEPGRYTVAYRVRLDTPTVDSRAPATLRVTVDEGRRELASMPLGDLAVGQWVESALPFEVDGPTLVDGVEFRLDVTPGTHLSIDSVTLPVRYARIEVVDPTDQLNTFNTHVSVFDAHPNERAHGVLADVLYERIHTHLSR